VSVNAIALDLKPGSGSNFVPYKGTNGSFQIGFAPVAKLELVYYGGRNLAYSVRPGASYYVDERTGVALQTALGWRSTCRLYWEKGRNPYVATTPGGVTGTDRLTVYGGIVSLKVGRSAFFNVGGSVSDYTSPVPDRNRSISQIQASLQLESGKGQWW
jgi:hypothetical protein